MQDRFEPSSLGDLETQLAALPPRASRIDRDRLLYEAGQAAARGSLKAVSTASAIGPARLWIWRLTTVAATTLALFAYWPSKDQPPNRVERPVQIAPKSRVTDRQQPATGPWQYVDSGPADGSVADGFLTSQAVPASAFDQIERIDPSEWWTVSTQSTDEPVPEFRHARTPETVPWIDVFVSALSDSLPGGD